MEYDTAISIAAKFDLGECKALTGARVLIGVMHFQGHEKMSCGMATTESPEVTLLYLLDAAARLAKEHGLDFQSTLNEVRTEIGFSG